MAVSAPTAGLSEGNGQQASRLSSGADGAEQPSTRASPSALLLPSFLSPWAMRGRVLCVPVLRVPVQPAARGLLWTANGASQRPMSLLGTVVGAPLRLSVCPLGSVRGRWPACPWWLFLGMLSRRPSRSGTWGRTLLGEDGGTAWAAAWSPWPRSPHPSCRKQETAFLESVAF